MKVHKQVDNFLKISTYNLVERPEISAIPDRNTPVSSFARQSTFYKNKNNDVNSSVTYHQILPSGEFMVKNALANIPDDQMPKREGRYINESDFINKVQGYLKKLKKRKSEKRVKKLK